MSRSKPRREVFACPNCGADVAVGATVCRECGSDASTGWKDQDEIDYAQVDLPDGWREDGAGEQLPPVRTAPWVRWTALVVVAALVASLVVVGLLRSR